MKSHRAILLTTICLLSFYSYGQSYIDDAKNLVAFKTFYELNQNKVTALTKAGDTTASSIDLATKIGREQFAIKILAAMGSASGETQDGSSDTKQPGNTTDEDENGGLVFADDDAKKNQETKSKTDQEVIASLQGPRNKALRNQFINASQIDSTKLDKLKRELAFYVRFVSDDLQTLFSNPKNLNTPDELVNLSTIIDMVDSESAAGFTGGGAAGSLLGVSQTQILQGIAEWALKRAEQELMQSFLREWVQKIEDNPILATTFPNTLRMLSTSDVSSIVTDGATWKATFLSDFDNIPAESPDIFEAIISTLDIKLEDATIREVKTGLGLMSGLAKDIGARKPVEKILMDLGAQSLVNAKQYTNPDDVPIIDRTLIATKMLLGIIENYSSDKVEFVNSSVIANLTKDDLDALWKLIILRNSAQLELIFGMTAAQAVALYQDVSTRLENLQLKLVQLAQNIERIYLLAETVSSRAVEDLKSTFTAQEFSTYINSIFGVLEGTISTLEEIGVKSPIFDKISGFSDTYLQGLKYITAVQQGVSTKEYGVVVLNALNFFVWVNETILKDPLFSKSELDAIVKAEDLLKNFDGLDMTSKEAIDKAFEAVKLEVSAKLKKFPQTDELLLKGLTDLNESIAADGSVTLNDLKTKVKAAFNFSGEQLRTVVKEVASEKLMSLQTTSEAINKYGKLMATIILAESSEDISQALESVANQTGGYIVRQKSQFSTTVSFYPGAAAGFESSKVSGQSSTSGSFASATLPIGVEWAIGTNWKPVSAVGLFIQVLDLGAVLNYSLNNDNEQLNDNPEIGFKQVLSPGGYLTLHITNSPITIGFGAKYLPNLRTISASDQSPELQANVFQVGGFLAVDLNVFTLSTSKKKFALESKSIQSDK